jgi:ElaB/YqjD/DUF883 family membrane-anchored ribosome-binding protein
MKITIEQLKTMVHEELNRLVEEDDKFLQKIKSTGEWTDYTIAQLKKKKAALMKKDKRTAAEQKKVKQIQFAINAKEGDYK